MRLFGKGENRFKTASRPLPAQVYPGEDLYVNAHVRFNDDCRNGHNSLGVTGTVVDETGKWVSCGCCHSEIRAAFPELSELIKYHLCSTDGPMHYLANTLYHARGISEKQDKWWFHLNGERVKLVGVKERNQLERIHKGDSTAVFKDHPNPLAIKPNLGAARRVAIWPDATLEQLSDEEQLKARLPEILAGLRQELQQFNLQFGDEDEG